jgi:hypothetical protein
MIDNKLTLAAANVARAAPQFWAEMIKALNDQTETQRNACISSPPDMLQVAQGRAQYATALLSLLKDCVHDVDQMRQRDKTR